MGCGKTTAGNELSRELSDYKYFDIDAEIEKVLRKNFRNLFKAWRTVFRMLETEKVRQFCNGDKAIISAGGGAFESEENRELMLKTSHVIYLKATPQEIYNRIKTEVATESNEHGAIGRKRPLLKKNFQLKNHKSYANA